MDKIVAAGFEYFEHRGVYYQLNAERKGVKVVLPTPEMKGAVQCLWDIFGGTVNERGFKDLDNHIGLIYGDSITPVRAIQILNGLRAKGFSSSNIVFGIGSFTYQYTTRDTYGFAVKATYGEVNGVGRDIFKDPVTDNGMKKSARGLLAVSNGILYEQQDSLGVPSDLVPVFKDGKILVEQTLAEIRARVAAS
jgi:nicotinamide phosphoribosyltransferase